MSVPRPAWIGRDSTLATGQQDTSDMDNRFDAVIIGAGIIGSAIGCGLARRGWQTLNVDRLETAGQGSTSSSVAIVRSHYSTLEGSALAWEGTQCWEDWRGHIGTDDPAGMAEFRQTGVLVLKTDGNDNLGKQIALSDTLQIPYQEWSTETIQAKLPGWKLDRFGPPVLSDDPRFGEPTGSDLNGGVFFPRAGYCNDPRLAAHNLQAAAQAAGAKFRFNSTVSAIHTRDGRTEGLDLNGSETIRTPVIVNAAGPHSAKISALAGIADNSAIKTRVIRHEYVRLARPDSPANKGAEFVTFDNDVCSYTRPDLGGTFLSGSAGTEVEGEQTQDPDEFDRNLSDAVMEPIYRLAQRIPSLGIPNNVTGIVDLWDVSDDWIPIYDCSDLAGFYLAVGTSGNQFKTAPAVGELMAELVSACEAGHDHDRDPVQFHLQRIDRSIGLEFFSRNRQINTTSSFSVMA